MLTFVVSNCILGRSILGVARGVGLVRAVRLTLVTACLRLPSLIRSLALVRILALPVRLWILRFTRLVTCVVSIRGLAVRTLVCA